MCAVMGFAHSADANPKNAPNAYFVFGGGIFENGQSQNIGPSAQKVLDEGMYWFEGDCTGANGRQNCDLLRMGATFYPAQCRDGSPAEMSHYLAPAEDGGQAVQDSLQNIQQNSVAAPYCESDVSYRPLGEALMDHQKKLFDGTDDDADSPWARPNLNLLVVSDMPQTEDESSVLGHSTDRRAKSAIGATCALLYGFDGDDRGGWPAMPTWVMMAREHSSDAATFGGLLAAAGGTGQCCYDDDYNANDPNDQPCDPTDPSQQVDVCQEFFGWSETEIRRGVANGKFQCAPGDSAVQTGSMDFGGDTKGTQAHILCHFAGSNGHSNCTGPKAEQNHRRPTDVLGKMSCIRQLPEDYDGGAIQLCDSDDNCRTLQVCQPSDTNCTGVEFIDPNNTLFVLRGVDGDGSHLCEGLANGGRVRVNPCPNEGDSCTVEENLDGTTAYGRCTVGRIYCDEDGNEKCEQIYNPMPEICNGLDDDCNGEVDNLSTSWDRAGFGSYDPTELDDYDKGGIDRTGIHCWERNVCSCSNGPLEYGGPGYQAHIESWTPGSCVCGEGLGQASSGGYTPAPAPDTSDAPKAACSATPSGGAAGGIALIAFGVFGLFIWRRKN